MRNSVRNLMCVGRYAEKMQWSEAKWSLFEPLARSNLFGQMPAIDMSELCIPAECDNIKLPFGGEIASRGMRVCYAIFAGISLRLCSISLRSLRITFAAYLPTHIKSLRDFPLFWFVFFWGVGWRFFLWCVTMLYIFFVPLCR